MGGTSTGAEMLGCETVYALDSDNDCCQTFKANHPDCEVVCKDIRDAYDFPEVDMVVGSPPCQSFSIANPSRDFDLTLTKEFFRVISIMKPKVWIMENVSAVERYYPSGHIFNSFDYSVPQKRIRYFLSNIYLSPNKTPPRVIKDVIPLPAGSFLVDSRTNHFCKKGERAVIDITKPSFTLTTECDGIHFIIPNNDNVYYDNVAESIKSYISNRYPHNNYIIRRISIGECLLLQSFPQDYKIPKTKAKNKPYIMIGNSVPPLMSKAIIKSVLDSNVLTKWR
jgi:DNA (cytosine-5)-methyltransferase 1